jgi:hypothetical protein
VQYRSTGLQATLLDGRTARPDATEIPATVVHRSSVPPLATLSVSEMHEATDVKESASPDAQVASEESSTGLLVVSIIMMLILCVLYAFAIYRESVKRGRRRTGLNRQAEENRARSSVPV